VSGLSMQSFMLTAGPDGIRELGPTLLCGLWRPGQPAGCPGSRS